MANDSTNNLSTPSVKDIGVNQLQSPTTVTSEVYPELSRNIASYMNHLSKNDTAVKETNLTKKLFIDELKEFLNKADVEEQNTRSSIDLRLADVCIQLSKNQKEGFDKDKLIDGVSTSLKEQTTISTDVGKITYETTFIDDFSKNILKIINFNAVVNLFSEHFVKTVKSIVEANADEYKRTIENQLENFDDKFVKLQQNRLNEDAELVKPNVSGGDISAIQNFDSSEVSTSRAINFENIKNTITSDVEQFEVSSGIISSEISSTGETEISTTVEHEVSTKTEEPKKENPSDISEIQRQQKEVDIKRKKQLYEIDQTLSKINMDLKKLIEKQDKVEEYKPREGEKEGGEDSEDNKKSKKKKDSDESGFSLFGGEESDDLDLESGTSTSGRSGWLKKGVGILGMAGGVLFAKCLLKGTAGYYSSKRATDEYQRLSSMSDDQIKSEVEQVQAEQDAKNEEEESEEASAEVQAEIDELTEIAKGLDEEITELSSLVDMAYQAAMENEDIRNAPDEIEELPEDASLEEELLQYYSEEELGTLDDIDVGDENNEGAQEETEQQEGDIDSLIPEESTPQQDDQIPEQPTEEPNIPEESTPVETPDEPSIAEESIPTVVETPIPEEQDVETQQNNFVEAESEIAQVESKPEIPNVETTFETTTPSVDEESIPDLSGIAQEANALAAKLQVLDETARAQEQKAEDIEVPNEPETNEETPDDLYLIHGETLDNLQDTIKDTLDGVEQDTMSSIQSISDSGKLIAEIAGNTLETAASTINQIQDGAATAISSVVDKANDTIDAAKEKDKEFRDELEEGFTERSKSEEQSVKKLESSLTSLSDDLGTLSESQEEALKGVEEVFKNADKDIETFRDTVAQTKDKIETLSDGFSELTDSMSEAEEPSQNSEIQTNQIQVVQQQPQANSETFIVHPSLRINFDGLDEQQTEGLDSYAKLESYFTSTQDYINRLQGLQTDYLNELDLMEAFRKDIEASEEPGNRTVSVDVETLKKLNARIILTNEGIRRYLIEQGKKQEDNQKFRRLETSDYDPVV